MIRILHYIPGFRYGGIESLFLEWYRFIDKSEFQFDLLTRVENENSLILKQYRNMGGRVNRLETLSFGNIVRFRKSVKKFFEGEEKYDIVHIHGDDPFIMYYAKRNGASKIILHSHTIKREEGGIKAWLNTNNEKIDLKLWADEGWACSIRAANWKFRGSKWSDGNVKIIHNPVNWKKYIFNNTVRKEVRNYWNLDDKFVVGTVGRITEAKNPNAVIDIFSMVKRKKENACLLWVGDGIKLTLAKKKIDELNLGDSIILTGYRDDIPELMQAMDVFVFPSLWEGLGLAALEAQAAGLKTVCSENVPEEVDVSPLCKHIPLDNMDSWVMEICEAEHVKREDTSHYFMDSVYDISYGIQELEKSYKEVLQDSM